MKEREERDGPRDSMVGEGEGWLPVCEVWIWEKERERDAVRKGRSPPHHSCIAIKPKKYRVESLRTPTIFAFSSSLFYILQKNLRNLTIFQHTLFWCPSFRWNILCLVHRHFSFSLHQKSFGRIIFIFLWQYHRLIKTTNQRCCINL